MNRYIQDWEIDIESIARSWVSGEEGRLVLL